MKNFIALSVVAGIATIGAVTACSSGSPPQSAASVVATDSSPADSSSPTITQDQINAVQQWAQVTGLPVTRALQMEYKSNDYTMMLNDSTLALNDAKGDAPEADVEAIYSETVYQYQQAADSYNAGDYQTGNNFYEQGRKDYVDMLALLDNEYGMNLSGTGNP